MSASGRIRSFVIVRDFSPWRPAMLSRPSAFGCAFNRSVYLRRRAVTIWHSMIYQPETGDACGRNLAGELQLAPRSW